LVGEYTLADIAHAGNFHRLRELAERGEVLFGGCPNVTAWMGRVESRESYKAST
jgi:glutathione S-transferase